MKDIIAIRAKRAELLAAAEKLFNASVESGTNLIGAELEQYNKHVADISALDEQIARHKQLATFESAVPATERPNLNAGLQRTAAAPNPELMAAFDRYLRTGDMTQMRAVTSGLNVGTATEGGSGVPTELHPVLIQKKRDANVVRQLAAPPINAAHDRTFVMTDADATAAWTAEEVAATAVKPTIKTAALKAYKGTSLIKVSEELLQDSIFDVVSYAIGQGGLSLGILEEVAFLVGTGTTQPSGLIPAATVGVTTASTTAITGDEIITHFHKLRAVYRNNATWLMKDATALIIRLLKNAVTGDYIWQPGLQAGQPDRLLGRPVAFSENVPAATAGLRSVVFGDFNYFQICDRLGAYVQRLNELYAATGQVGFKFVMRTDGALLNAEAMQVILMHA